MFISVDGYENEFCQVCNSKETGDAKQCHRSNLCFSFQSVRNQLIKPYRSTLCSHCGQYTTLDKYTLPTTNDCKPHFGKGFFETAELIRDLFFSIKIGGKIMDTPKQVKISEVVL
jgi:hypothetical protein